MSRATNHAPAHTDSRLLRISNAIVGGLARFGIGPAACHELLVAGRTSGRVTGRPVNVMEVNGSRYLLSPRGQTQWVLNVRAGQTAVLRRRHTSEAVELIEITDDRRIDLLRTYLARWGWQVSAFVNGLSASSSNEDLAAALAQFPIFECRSVGHQCRGPAQEPAGC
ncbi:nitroreductase [Gordonia sp. (in: high G+C Gram-positive bacteria)]|uniref:nitroreductase n=1 Tax=Gordonia sp. (in: high G+C Gram-positive bacteria) TaxID=84139 RepID=UPI003C747EE0